MRSGRVGRVSLAYVMKILKHSRISAPPTQKRVDVLGEIARTKPLSPFAFLREFPQAEPGQVLPMPALEGPAPPSKVASPLSRCITLSRPISYR